MHSDIHTTQSLPMTTDSAHPVHTATTRTPHSKESTMNTLSHHDFSLRTDRTLAEAYRGVATAHPVFCVLTTSPLDLCEEEPGRAPDGVSDEELLRTFDERGALTDLVQALYPDATPAQQRRAYANLAQRRARLARTLRRTRRAACDWR